MYPKFSRLRSKLRTISGTSTQSLTRPASRHSTVLIGRSKWLPRGGASPPSAPERDITPLPILRARSRQPQRPQIARLSRPIIRRLLLPDDDSFSMGCDARLSPPALELTLPSLAN